MGASKGKVKCTLWTYPETLKKAEEMYKEDDCISRSEFIEKAILFYIGYLTAEDESGYLPNIFLSTMKNIVSSSENHISRILFKFSVEMAMVMNILAAYHRIDDMEIRKLRDSCVKEIKRMNGNFSFKDAIEWQNS